MAAVTLFAPDLSEEATYQAVIAAIDTALADWRATTAPGHFTMAALSKYPPAYGALKKFNADPYRQRRLAQLIRRYGPQAGNPLVLTGNLRNEILYGATKYTTRSGKSQRVMTWPNAPRYVYQYSLGRRAERGGAFNKAAAVTVLNPDEAQRIQDIIRQELQKFFDTPTVRQTSAA